MSVFSVVVLKFIVNKLRDWVLDRDLETTSHYSCMAAISVGIPTIDIIRVRL